MFAQSSSTPAMGAPQAGKALVVASQSKSAVN